MPGFLVVDEERRSGRRTSSYYKAAHCTARKKRELSLEKIVKEKTERPWNGVECCVPREIFGKTL